MNNNQIEKLLTRAKISLLSKKNSVFLATVCLSLETIITDEVDTAATNGKYIKYNPKFFQELSNDERVFLLAHETLHVAFMHMLRRNGRNPMLWNVAADYAINAALIEQNFKMPKGGLYDAKYSGLDAETIYDMLIQEGKQGESGWSDLDEPSSGVGEDGEPTSSKAAIDAVQKEIEGILVRATTQAQLQGGSYLPPGMERLLSDIMNPILPWKSILRRFLKGTSKTNYTWNRPNSKYGVLLPRLNAPKVGRIDMAIDVSGSIDDKQFNQFIAEVFQVLKTVKPTEVGLIQFDHSICGNEPVKTVHDLKTIKFKGGGGTRALRAFEAFAKNDSQALVILTDGGILESTLPKIEKRPVIWCVYSNPGFQCPRPRNDKVIHFTLKG